MKAHILALTFGVAAVLVLILVPALADGAFAHPPTDAACPECVCVVCPECGPSLSPEALSAIGEARAKIEAAQRPTVKE